MTFTENINNWYSVNKRDLPWRQNKNPYRIWLSEIIMQQTRVEQGMPYFERFIKAFPTVFDLANASEEEVLTLWQGLGYYSRARNLHAAAQYVVQEYKGVFPDRFELLLKLKGVGDYTASAIASICFDEAQAVLDGNVFRVLSRYFGIETPIDTSIGQREFRLLAQSLLPKSDFGDYNQALMDFGSQQCAPKKPNCSNCDLQPSCAAYATGKQSLLPIKKGKTKIQLVVFNYIVFLDESGRRSLIRKRTEGIWTNLYEFPLLESKKRLTIQQVQKHIKADFGFDSEPVLYNETGIIHKLSHKKIEAYFFIVPIKGQIKDLLDLEEIDSYPMPVLLNNFVSEISNK